MKIPPLLTLIADDSEDDRFLFSRAVRSTPGFTLSGVTRDGVETIAYLRGYAPYDNRTKYPYPDVLLLDYRMPWYTGIDVLASLCGHTPHPKVVLWSNCVEEVNKQLALRLGAEMVCTKPVLLEELRPILRKMQACPVTRARIRGLALLASQGIHHGCQPFSI